jgi:hypothetical protein
VGEITMAVTVDTGGRRQLGYDIAVSSRSECWLEKQSLVSWLGIARQTTWDRITSGNEDAAAELVAQHCSHFRASLEKRLGG